MGKFKITDLRNEVKIGLIAGGHEYAIEYKNNKFWFNGVALGSFPSGVQRLRRSIRTSTPTDGKVWHATIYSFTADVTVNAAPDGRLPSG